MQMKVKAVFRAWKNTGTGIVLFPYLLDNRDGHCASYEITGEHSLAHSLADYDHVISKTYPLLPSEPEFKKLFSALKARGYDLQVITKKGAPKNKWEDSEVYELGGELFVVLTKADLFSVGMKDDAGNTRPIHSPEFPVFGTREEALTGLLDSAEHWFGINS